MVESDVAQRSEGQNTGDSSARTIPHGSPIGLQCRWALARHSMYKHAEIRLTWETEPSRYGRQIVILIVQLMRNVERSADLQPPMRRRTAIALVMAA